MHVLDIALTGLDTNPHTWSPSNERPAHTFFFFNMEQIYWLISIQTHMLAIINDSKNPVSETAMTKSIR